MTRRRSRFCTCRALLIRACSHTALVPLAPVCTTPYQSINQSMVEALKEDDEQRVGLQHNKCEADRRGEAPRPREPPVVVLGLDVVHIGDVENIEEHDGQREREQDEQGDEHQVQQEGCLGWEHLPRGRLVDALAAEAVPFVASVVRLHAVRGVEPAVQRVQRPNDEEGHDGDAGPHPAARLAVVCEVEDDHEDKERVGRNGAQERHAAGDPWEPPGAPVLAALLSAALALKETVGEYGRRRQRQRLAGQDVLRLELFFDDARMAAHAE